jgi:hypothetical protein
VVRDVAAAGNIPLADGPARLAAASPDSIVGWELMVDHVHPTARGHALLARAIVEMLAARRGRLQVPPGWSARAPTDAELLAAHGADGVEAYALAYAAAELLARPPLEQHDRSAWNRRQAELGWQQLSPAEQAGFSTWVRLGRRPPLALTVADKLFEARRFADAVRHYSAARLEAPFTPWADLWPALRQGRARMYLQDGTLTAEQHRELQLVRRRAALVAGVPETDPAFMRTFYDYADRLSAAPSAGPDR